MTTLEAIQICVQGLGVAAVTVTLWVYYRQMRTMDRQAQAAEAEMAARLRPWVGLFGLEYVPSPQETLRVLLRNVGPLPAQDAHLEISVFPREGPASPVVWREQRLKALVPGEEGNYHIDLAQYSDFAAWRDAHKEVVVDGTMSYSLGGRSFRSRFEASLRFKEPLDEQGRVKTLWRNVEVL
jgi:hypothetical protein